MSANDKQIGGVHYGMGEYQHWDWANDVRLPGIPYAASKYVDRWRLKNGREDLEKALHYLEKAEELKISLIPVTDRAAMFWRYVIGRNHVIEDAAILWYVQEGDWAAASAAVQVLLERLPAEDSQDRLGALEGQGGAMGHHI